MRRRFGRTQDFGKRAGTSLRVRRRDVDVIGKGGVKRIGFHPQLMDARGGLLDRSVIVIIEMRRPGADLDHAEAARANARQAIKNFLLVKAAG